MTNVARSSLIVTVFTVLGFVMSFMSSVIIAAKFGAKSDMDIFLASTAVPFYINTIFIGILNVILIPVFAEHQQKGDYQLWQIASRIINFVVLGTGILCAAVIFFAPSVIRLIAPGFSLFKSGQAAHLLKYLMPLIVFTGVGEILTSIYYSRHSFFIPSLNKLISPLFTVLFVLFYQSHLSVMSLVLALVAASAVQTVLLAIGLAKNNYFHYELALDFQHPAIRQIFKLSLPLLGGILISKAVPLFDRFFLSELAEGSIAHIGYATKILSVISQLVVVGISISIFPLLSQYAAGRQWESLSDLIDKGIRMVLYLSVPFLVFLALFGKDVISILLQHGKFTAGDTESVYLALTVYLLSLPATGMGTIISQIYYALQMNISISIISSVMLVLYLILCVFLVPRFGFLAIPLAFFLYNSIALLTISLGIRKRVSIPWRKIVKSFATFLFIAGVSILPFLMTKILWPNNLSLSFIYIGLGFLSYLSVGHFWMKREEATRLWTLIADRFAERRVF
jgi:putative peptidoglycan lipid II flippase